MPVVRLLVQGETESLKFAQSRNKQLLRSAGAIAFESVVSICSRSANQSAFQFSDLLAHEGPLLSSVQSSEPRRPSPAIMVMVRNWPSTNWEVWGEDKFLRRFTLIFFPKQEKLGPASHRKARGFRHHLCVDLSASC